MRRDDGDWRGWFRTNDLSRVKHGVGCLFMRRSACKSSQMAKWPNPLMLRVGADTAQYGRVRPNEWPNGEVHTRDMDAADRARDGRDREHVHRGGGAPNRH